MLICSEGALRCRYNPHRYKNSLFPPSKPHLSTAPLRLKPPTAVCALNHILHLTMEDDEVGPPSLSYSCYRPPRPASVTCQDLTLTQNQGASPRELLLEACRRNNTNLLAELLARFPTPDKIAHLLNTSTDGVGNYCLHVAAAHGACRSFPHAHNELRTLCSQ